MKSKNQSVRFFADNLYFPFCWLGMPQYAKMLISKIEKKNESCYGQCCRVFHIIVKGDSLTAYNAIQFCEVALSFQIESTLNESKSLCIQNLATNNNILDS